MEITDFNVDGMSCQACVSHVTKALLGVAGVSKVDVNLEDKKALVEFDPEITTVQALIDTVDEEGYTLTPR